MRRFLSNADTPRNQRPEQEQIDLESDEYNEVQDTVEELTAVKEILDKNALGP